MMMVDDDDDDDDVDQSLHAFRITCYSDLNDLNIISFFIDT